MYGQKISRRALVMTGCMGAGAALAMPYIGARAGTRPFTLMTNWYAQPDQGGFYQAQETGLYRRAGLDVQIRSGSPQLNAPQMLLSGAVDAIVGFDTQVILQRAKGLPVKAVAAIFQQDVEGLIAHTDVNHPEELRTRTLLLAPSSMAAYWPWMKQRFGFSDNQVRPYAYNLQPFVIDPTVAIQAILTAEPCDLQRRNVPFRFFTLADYGYPPYSGTIVTRDGTLTQDAERLRIFLKASLEGYRDYLLGDPTPGNNAIMRENRLLDVAHVTCARDALRRSNPCFSGDAVQGGLGIMTAARWQATARMMADTGQIPDAAVWKEAFTTDFLPATPVVP